MGKNLRQQRRGRGTPTYRAHSFRWITDVKHRRTDEIERQGTLPGKIIDLVDCPGHTAPLAKVQYANKEVSYIFAPTGIRVNDAVESGFSAKPTTGSTLPLKNIPEGTPVYNIENIPFDGGKLVRAAGTSARVVTIKEEGVVVLLPSRKEKVFNPLCRATVGTIAGSGRLDKPMLKAGSKHHLMRAKGKLYPITSGVAMNAVDHPFGCGRGRHVGKPKTPSRFAPPGAKVGLIGARRTGRKR